MLWKHLNWGIEEDLPVKIGNIHINKTLRTLFSESVITGRILHSNL